MLESSADIEPGTWNQEPGILYGGWETVSVYVCAALK